MEMYTIGSIYALRAGDAAENRLNGSRSPTGLKYAMDA